MMPEGSVASAQGAEETAINDIHYNINNTTCDLIKTHISQFKIVLQ
jgi:hypothetical protein